TGDEQRRAGGRGGGGRLDRGQRHRTGGLARLAATAGHQHGGAENSPWIQPPSSAPSHCPKVPPATAKPGLRHLAARHRSCQVRRVAGFRPAQARAAANDSLNSGRTSLPNRLIELLIWSFVSEPSWLSISS